MGSKSAAKVDKKSKKDTKAVAAATKVSWTVVARSHSRSPPRSRSCEHTQLRMLTSIQVAKVEKKSKKSKKEPTPESSSSESSDSESDSSASSSESEEEKKPAAKAAKGKAAVKKAETSSSSDSDSSDSESEAEKPAAKAAKGKAAPAAAKEASSSSDSDSDSSDSDSDEEEEKTEKKEEKKAESSDSDSSDSDSDSDEEEEAKPASNKRKAEEESEESATPAPVKKVKTSEGEQDATNTVFVGGLSWNIDNDWLASEFATCGEVISARIVLDRDTQRSRGFGYVEFADVDSAIKAIEFEGKELDGRAIRVNFANARKPDADKRAKVFNDKRSDPADTLWIGSLPFDTTEDHVYEAFGEYGDVQSVRLPTDRDTGAAKGFGYVTFGDVAQATAALEALNGTEFGSRRIRIDFAPPKPENNGGGGGFGGRGGGRGGFGGRGGGGRGGGGFGGRGGGGRGGGRGRGGPPRGGARTGGIVEPQGQKVTFD